jgi:uncharacterized repeat protein (TIGR03803 family)
VAPQPVLYSLMLAGRETMKLASSCAAALILSCCFALGQAQENILYSFGTNPNDGLFGGSTLVLDHAGNLYGTTMAGGTNNEGGTIFELSPNSDGIWTESVLYSFCNSYSDCPSGSGPTGLAIDPAGNLYGTTSYGGLSSCPIVTGVIGCGVVFELSPPPVTGGPWTYSVLYTFCTIGSACKDGALPLSPPTLDRFGNLYGTAEAGEDDGGVVFELSKSSRGWSETILYNFCSTGGNYCSDGMDPGAGVVFDKAGNLYGTTNGGGKTDSNTGGAIYKLSPGLNGWTESVLATFPSPRGYARNTLGPLSVDGPGNLYTTSTGFNGLEYSGGFLAELEVIGDIRGYRFNSADGLPPLTGVIIDSRNAVLYGTTGAWPVFCGNVFEINKKTWQETVLHNFCQPGDGYQPGGLVEDRSGNLYGTTLYGGAHDDGMVFEIIP